jgi:hypothetical protein
MKKLIYITAIILFGIAVNPAYAASATPAPTKSNDPVKEKLNSQINELKEKIASRVSELNLVEKRGLIGTVTEVKGNQLTLSDTAGNTRFVKSPNSHQQDKTEHLASQISQKGQR